MYMKGSSASTYTTKYSEASCCSAVAGPAGAAAHKGLSGAWLRLRQLCALFSCAFSLHAVQPRAGCLAWLAEAVRGMLHSACPQTAWMQSSLAPGFQRSTRST
jgi:hypothetical protein